MKQLKRIANFILASLLAAVVWGWLKIGRLSPARKEELTGILADYRVKAASMKGPMVGAVKIGLVLWLGYYVVLWSIVSFTPARASADLPILFFLLAMLVVAVVPIPEKWIK